MNFQFIYKTLHKQYSNLLLYITMQLRKRQNPKEQQDQFSLEEQEKFNLNENFVVYLFYYFYF